nr:MAG TPA: hypothetical protein [Caudoviricetes sp.]
MTESEYRIKSMQWSIEAKEEEVEAAKKDIQELLNDMGGNFDCEVALRISRESATLLKAVAELKSLQTQKQLLVAMSTEEK